MTPPPGRFASTQWSLVLAARGEPTTQARDALAELCHCYWYPLYAYVRKQVGCPERAQDLTQEFFTHLLGPGFLDAVDPCRGRFRAYLLACCKHFLINQRVRDQALKRGGGRSPLPLDFADADERYRHEPADGLTPERLFERRWALTLLEQSLDELAREYRDAGKADLFDRLKPSLVEPADAPPHALIAEALGMSEAAVRKAAQRLRDRYRELLREHIATTVEGPDQVDDEVRSLFAALGG